MGSLKIVDLSNLSGSRLINLHDPIEDGDAANKGYVDSIVRGSNQYAGVGLSLINYTFDVLPNQPQIIQVGNINQGSWQASSVQVPYGGTGQTTFTANKLLIGNGTSPISSVSDLTYNGSVFSSNCPITINNTNSNYSTNNGDNGLTVLGGISTNRNLYVNNDAIIIGNVTIGNLTLNGNLGLNNLSATMVYLQI